MGWSEEVAARADEELASRAEWGGDGRETKTSR
jgi:hypothetical protein